MVVSSRYALYRLSHRSSFRTHDYLPRCCTLAHLHGPSLPTQILAHNNLACYYRKLRQPARALQHLEQTAQLETEALVAVASETIAEQEATSNTARNSNTPETKGYEASVNRTGESSGPVPLAAPGPTAATLLNLAAVSGSMGRHGQALTYASQAVVAAGRELQVKLRRHFSLRSAVWRCV